MLGYNIFYYYYLLANLINKALFSLRNKGPKAVTGAVAFQKSTFVHFGPFRGTYKYCILEPNLFLRVREQAEDSEQAVVYFVLASFAPFTGGSKDCSPDLWRCFQRLLVQTTP